MRGLFVGRFQPFHMGHLKAVEWILEKEGCERVIVLVGSSQRCYDIDNPFTVGERIEMIVRTLAERGYYSRAIVLSVPDIMNNALWVAHVNSLVPPYDVVYSNNPLVKKLFEDAGKRVKSTPLFDRKAFDATRIRRSMLRGTKAWRKLVPAEVASFIDEIGGVQRIRAVAGGDKLA
ncbi:MAG: nicotinamide-nucleotide adenylyltransferase [Candidatus Micrarchaeia archaeon]